MSAVHRGLVWFVAALSAGVMGWEGGNADGGGLADVGAVTRPPSRFYIIHILLREHRRVLV